MDMSSWILDRLLPQVQERFQELVAALADPDGRSFALAAVADFLRGLHKVEFSHAVALPPRVRLDPAVLNLLAGAIELACERRKLKAPEWADRVPIPDLPAFGSQLDSLRLHLLTTAPVAFRRRNLFMDSSFDQRV